ncbi:hypothetical protein F8B43_3843 [Methylorubrum populi]|uniref:Uncharacterized protein n=1 Tax=Methylorubrum populi TaxID=223967 RepID=A0A833J3K4_9HYPH|nr:hypothetical protein F8B43_3843 [Methylorubrum populi]
MASLPKGIPTETTRHPVLAHRSRRIGFKQSDDATGDT